jgi:enamine deaminase RidA (YjgF/YER057c/UK114 family)
VTVPEPEFSVPPAPADYSHAVSLAAGRLVWTSGQIAVDEDGAVPPRLGGADAPRLRAPRPRARAVGAGWADVVKLTLFVVDVAEVATVRDEFIDTARPPTSSLVRVAGLVRPDLLIEVEAVAWLP